jgi:DNA-binding XRE family transcriptional regulator
MISVPRITIEGTPFVLLKETEYERLCRDAGEALPADDLPKLPAPDKHGRFSALEFARMALARDLVRARRGAGLSQSQLAKLAGIRQETLSRLETGKHTASPKTVDKIVQAVERWRRKHDRLRR